MLKCLLRHVHCLWLFSYSDLKTIVLPKSAFGLLHAFSAPLFGLSPPSTSVLYIIAPVIFWTWLNLLPFLISNQRKPLSILEDRINKPWRPMPSNLMTQREAKIWMFSLYVCAALASVWLGGLKQCLALVILGFWYNDLQGAEYCISRNAINAVGFICYASGAMEVARAQPLRPERMLISWFSIIAAVVFTTVQLQDMYDQTGDRYRGRKTLPLTVGDGTSRWITFSFMVLWSLICPLFWSLKAALSLCFGTLGVLIAIRVLLVRTVPSDRSTFRLWNGWMILLYAMPWVKFIEL